MYAWEAIQNAIDYIEDNLTMELKIEAIAKESHLSQYYFQRLFTKLVGKSVNEYIKARRVAHSKELLKKTDRQVIDIALSLGFNSHEAFTKAFKEVYNITPSEYRNKDILLNDYLKPTLAMNYTLIDTNVPLIVDEMIIEIREEKNVQAETYSGFSKIIDASEMNNVGENSLIELWNKFNKDKKTMLHLKKDGIAIDYFVMEPAINKVKYFVGGQIESHSSEYEEIILPTGNYYVCSFEAEDFQYLVEKALYKANNYFFDVWLPHRGINMEDMKPFLVEKYFDILENPRIEIWIMPINKGSLSNNGD